MTEPPIDPDEDPGFDLLEGTDAIAWRRPTAVGLVVVGVLVLIWAFTLLLNTTSFNAPPQSGVPFEHPFQVFGAFALALILVCIGGILMGRPARSP